MARTPTPVQLVIASNRGPLTRVEDGNGDHHFEVGSGGVATAMWSVVKNAPNALYVASALDQGDYAVAATAAVGQPALVDLPDRAMRMRYVLVDRQEYELFYNYFANPFLWFLQHGLYRAEYAVPDAKKLEYAFTAGYLPVNGAFGETIGRAIESIPLQPDVRLQDYHLNCVAPVVRGYRSDAVISQFMHTPWMPAEEWRARVPADIRTTLLQGICANDIVGFQTDEFRENFLATCVDTLGISAKRTDETLRVGGHTVYARTYPISVDPEEREALARSPEVAEARKRLADLISPSDLVIAAVGREDLSKNWLNFLAGVDVMLSQYPSTGGRVRIITHRQTTRGSIPEYAQYAQQIRDAVAALNAKYGAGTCIEIVSTEDMAFAAATMERADVNVVIPIADGMNLVAKDSVIFGKNSALVLSRSCGAFQELGSHAVAVDNPYDVNEIGYKLHVAATMDPQERGARARAMWAWIDAHPISLWAENQDADVQTVIGLRGRSVATLG